MSIMQPQTWKMLIPAITSAESHMMFTVQTDPLSDGEKLKLAAQVTLCNQKMLLVEWLCLDWSIDNRELIYTLIKLFHEILFPSLDSKNERLLILAHNVSADESTFWWATLK